MVRLQIQLTEKQLRAVRSMASRSKVPISEIVRRAVDSYVRLERLPDPAERRAGAISVAGRFRSGRSDISRQHDDYLAEAFRK